MLFQLLEHVIPPKCLVSHEVCGFISVLTKVSIRGNMENLRRNMLTHIWWWYLVAKSCPTLL